MARYMFQGTVYAKIMGNVMNPQDQLLEHFVIRSFVFLSDIFNVIFNNVNMCI